MTLEYPEDLRYLDSHEYVRLDGEIATIGITAFAIEELGDIVFLELPELGDAIEVEDNIGTIESVKAVSEIYAPVAGTVIDRNDMLIESPEAIADDPYGEGWLIKVRLDNPDDELENTLSVQEYRSLIEPEE
ncbi:glycine cleavage system protein GcvH [Cyanobacterium aponinum UTEX 3222]|uniref:Glycine cleavage system H protein n=3 Tax=Cyanobacterium aponinum TaxID=379064 RepID=K9Z8M3_CYAAP|nr:glycine cleavage system protein GcvH [Cyanobacterium aponinum]WRL42409.1 glycine cleavage system protein GcvH [Cyanobacterium aponinum UTEX 3222]AFZ55514.1 glycine cleavage system H protein [Cyanobacterium aponinum PCC 10605]MTF38194.1 glycine cleavage system protein GcvH [Cyanobacterium aponinum 0216]PHV63974.1 glycine cleavage system protein H [Cyanobacterium aponinum IPPAS B-1201]WPF88691.1 glycine cleavage system protein GcvH [Cyanobacterium aponinum AL20115]